MKKKLIAYLLSSVLFITTAFCGLGTPVYAASTNTSGMPELTDENYKFTRDPETGHISAEDNFVSNGDNSSKRTPSAALPSSYGSIDYIKSTYPNTRDQNPYGTCWAFAATACAEFDMVKNHGYSRSKADFSELQLAYFNFNPGYETTELNGDRVYIPSSASENYLDCGGNMTFSMHTLSQWKCYTYETNLPYSNAGGSIGASWSLYNDAAKLKNLRFMDIKNDPASVKQAIMDYGAVYISYGVYDGFYSINGNNCFYYNPYYTATNHDVVIVGWDDTVPTSMWPAGARPSQPGAWIVRNSWTTDQSQNIPGTYFYMSYQEKSLANNAYALDYNPYAPAENLYQYDGVTTSAYAYTNKIANIYTAGTQSSAVSEKLTSIMIPFLGGENVKYQIEIYTGVSSGNPTSGYLNSYATTTGYTDKRGIYTINLKNPVYLYPGEKFAIVVTTLNGKSNFQIEITETVTYYQDGRSHTWFSTNAHVDSGESFVYNNNSWYDVIGYNNSYSSTQSYGNIRLKGVTVENSTPKYKVTYNLNGGTNNINNPNGFPATYSGTCTLQNPTRSGYHFCGWYTDASFRNKATYINYNNKTNQTFYAKWCSNNNQNTTQVIAPANCSSSGSYRLTCSGCGLIKGTYTIPAISSIKLNYTSMVYTGENRSPVPVITAADGSRLVSGTDYTYSYSRSSRYNVGRYYVTVNFKGKYNEGRKTLYYSVVPKAPASASAKLADFNDIKVSWAKSTGAAGYYVYYKKASAANYTNYKITTNRSIKFVNMAGNTKYNFKIVPYFNSNSTKYKSNKSRIVSATTLKKLNQPTFTRKGNNKVSLRWQSIKAASGYQVYWSTKKDGKYNKLCDYSNQYVGVTFTSPAGKTYWYKTRAYRYVDGKKVFAPWSNPKSFRY